MSLARAWTRQLLGASGAALLVPGTIACALGVLAFAGGFARLGSIGEALSGPVAPPTGQVTSAAGRSASLAGARGAGGSTGKGGSGGNGGSGRSGGSETLESVGAAVDRILPMRPPTGAHATPPLTRLGLLGR